MSKTKDPDEHELASELDFEDGETQDYETDTGEDAEDQLDQEKTKRFAFDLTHDDLFIENKM